MTCPNIILSTSNVSNMTLKNNARRVLATKSRMPPVNVAQIVRELHMEAAKTLVEIDRLASMMQGSSGGSHNRGDKKRLGRLWTAKTQHLDEITVLLRYLA